MNATGDAASALWYSLLAIFRVDLEGDLVAAESLTPFRSSVLFALKSLWDSSGEKSVQKKCRLHHQPHQAARAADGARTVSEVQQKEVCDTRGD